MAETVIGLVVQNLAPLILQEIKSSRAVRKKVQSIKNELESIRPYLQKADAKAAAEELDQGDSNEGVRKWIEQIREEAYRIEDVLDEFKFLVAQLHHGTGLSGVLPRICHCMKMLKLRCKIASDLEDIKSSLAEIYERGKRYGLISPEGSRNGMKDIKNDGIGDISYSIEEDQIVGNESTRKDLLDWLLEERTQRRLFVLMGAGGLGKTTLVASVYKYPAARNCFDCYAWIEVGRAYSKEDVFRKLLRQFYRSRKEPPQESIEIMDTIALTHMLKDYLKEKCYMVVFDDLWQADFWKCVEHVLLDNGKDNRIIITSRKRDVAELIPGSGDHIRVCVLEGLPSDKAWKLFCRKAFSDGVCPPHLENLSHDILKKCAGLPLAIVAVGGLLSKKNKVDDEWKRLLNNLGSELARDIHLKDCNRVLCESYNDLPDHLKPCLLYFTLFPASYLVESERLIHLWVAEGFVQDDMNNSLDVAEEYLTELIRRSLVQVSETSIEGKPTSVRVHELMHEIILRKAKQLGFSQVLKEQDLSQQIKTRRIAVHKSTSKVVESVKDSKVRSMFLFDVDELPITFISALFIANFKLMKVLDFQDAPLDYDLPKQVGNLFNLRYLSLRNTKIKVLPKSIGKLFNLETLDLRHTLVSEAPEEIKNLKKLRCLLVRRSDTLQLNQLNQTSGGGMTIQESIGSLTELQELTFVEADFKVVKEIRKLRKLKKLGIQVTNGKGKDLCDSISNMENLKSLDLESMDADEIIDLQSIASPPQYLELLNLDGNLKQLPDWISNLKNLVKMHLTHSGLTDDPLRVLHGLPNLMELALVEAYNGEKLHFAEGWFPKLVNLILVNLKELQSMIFDNGALPVIQSIQIGPCPLLEEATGILNLKSLTELVLVDILKKLVDDIVNSPHSFKVFIIKRLEGKYITEMNHNHPPLPELQKSSKEGKEGKTIVKKDYDSSILPERQQESKDDEDGKNIDEKGHNPPMQHEVQKTSKDDREGEKNSETDDGSPVLPELQQASKYEEGTNIIEKNFDPPIQPKLKRESKDDEEEKNIIEKDCAPPALPELQQASKDEEEKNITEKDYSHPVLPEHQQANKNDEEGKDTTEKDYSALIQAELQQASKDVDGTFITEKNFDPPILPKLQQASVDEEVKNIIKKDYTPPALPELQKAIEDEEEQNIIEKDHSPLVQAELQQASKKEEGTYMTEKNFDPPIQPKLQQESKDDEEGKNIIEKDCTPPVLPELQQASKDEEGKNIIEKNFDPPVLPELQEANNNDEKGTDITRKDSIPSLQLELVQTSKDEEGTSIIKNNLDPPILPELQQAGKDNKAGKNNIEKDYSPPVFPKLQQSSNDAEGKKITKLDFSRLVPPKLQETSKDDKEGKDINKKDYSRTVQPEPEQPTKNIYKDIARWGQNVDITKS